MGGAPGVLTPRKRSVAAAATAVGARLIWKSLSVPVASAAVPPPVAVQPTLAGGGGGGAGGGGRPAGGGGTEPGGGGAAGGEGVPGGGGGAGLLGAGGGALSLASTERRGRHVQPMQPNAAPAPTATAVTTKRRDDGCTDDSAPHFTRRYAGLRRPVLRSFPTVSIRRDREPRRGASAPRRSRR